MWVPIALAAFLAFFTYGVPLPTALIATIGTTIQPLIGAFVMRRMGFNPRLKDNTRYAHTSHRRVPLPQQLRHGQSSFPCFRSQFSRFDAHGVGPRVDWPNIVSILILTPLICVWVRGKMDTLRRRHSEN
jgi:hypothetical protein